VALPSVSVTLPNLPATLAGLQATLPKLPVSPGNLATAAVVDLALQAQVLAQLNWQVPASIPAVGIGLATASLSAHLQVALGIRAVMSTPCGVCDAAALLRALG
jgi:hypothetical protein